MKIFKYVIVEGGTEMPRNAEILSVQHQQGVLTAWAMVDPEESLIKRRIKVLGTGWEVPHGISEHEHIATAQDAGGFVWHVFDGPEEAIDSKTS